MRSDDWVRLIWIERRRGAEDGMALIRVSRVLM